MKKLMSFTAMLVFASSLLSAEPWLLLPAKNDSGKTKTGQAKNIVLISGDEEYRSEEALPQLGKILSQHHGFNCTVLFAIDKDGSINPKVLNNIPGMASLEKADLIILFTRMRELPSDSMKHFIKYLESGKPIIGLRTATHAFAYKKDSEFYEDFDWKNSTGGFGKKVFGETWVAHHGVHGKEGCRGIFVKGKEKHPILNGVKDGELFGPTDVYTVKLPLPDDSEPIVLGQVTKTLDSKSDAVEGKKNEPMMPIMWTKTYSWKGGPKGKIFVSTLASSQDFENEALRRVLVNAAHWCLGMESPEMAKVDIIGEYKPSPFKFDGFKKGVKPEDLK